jgi:hypothetical protein
MPDAEFDSLADYESFVRSTIEPWSPERRTCLAAAMAERWLPAYVTFTASEDWGDPAVLRQSLDAVWNSLRGAPSSAVEWSRHKKDLDNVTPHMDDFDANEALCVCVMIQYAIDCCITENNQSPAVMAVLSGLEAVQADLLIDHRLPLRFWKRAPIRKELSKQLRLIEHVNALPNLNDALHSLRSFLADPKIAGELRRRQKSKRPTAGLTNQSAFEQYRRMVQSDIETAATALDPRQNPAFAEMLYLSAWLGRYRRRKEAIAGSLADHTAVHLLVANNRAKDLAEKEIPDWEAATRRTIDLCYQNSLNGLDTRTPEEPHGYGPSLRRLWIEAKRRGLSDQGAWESIDLWARHQPDAWRMKSGKKEPTVTSISLKARLARTLRWSAAEDPDMPWITEVDGASWQVRLNDFPDELMYSLLIGDKVVGDFHDWPKTWKR